MLLLLFVNIQIVLMYVFFHPEHIDWESALYHAESEQQTGVVVTEFPSPLNNNEMRELQAVVDPLAPSESWGRDIFCCCIQLFQ